MQKARKALCDQSIGHKIAREEGQDAVDWPTMLQNRKERDKKRQG